MKLEDEIDSVIVRNRHMSASCRAFAKTVNTMTPKYWDNDALVQLLKEFGKIGTELADQLDEQNETYAEHGHASSVA